MLDTKSTYIFDLDGTLIDSSPDIIEGVNYTLSKFNLPPKTDDEIMSNVGKGLRYLLKKVLPESFDEDSLEKAYKIQKNFYETKEIKAIPYDGAKELLTTLKEMNKNIFIVTNKPQKATLKVLKTLKLTEFFNGIFGADSLKEHKPSPYPVNYISKTYDINKKHMIFTGDSITDFETSKNAGIDFILVTYGYETKEINAKYKIDNLLKILELK